MDYYSDLMLRYALIVICLLIKDTVTKIRGRHAISRNNIRPTTRAPAALILQQRDNSTWMALVGVNVQAFDQLQLSFQAFYPRRNALGRRRLFDSRSVLAVTLMWLHTTANLQVMGTIFGATLSSMSRTVNKGLQTLETLFQMETGLWAIRWPNSDEMRQYASTVQARSPDLHCIFGFVDGLNLKIQQPADPNDRMLITMGRSLHVLRLSMNRPGSEHDSRIAAPLYEKLQSVPHGFRLIADPAFPGASGRSHDTASKILRVPKQHTREYDRSDRQWYAIITRERQTVEWGIRSIQSTFPHLKLPLLSDDRHSLRILKVVFRLYNFRVRSTGVNQVRTVYEDAIRELLEQ